MGSVKGSDSVTHRDKRSVGPATSSCVGPTFRPSPRWLAVGVPAVAEETARVWVCEGSRAGQARPAVVVVVVWCRGPPACHWSSRPLLPITSTCPEWGGGGLRQATVASTTPSTTIHIHTRFTGCTFPSSSVTGEACLHQHHEHVESIPLSLQSALSRCLCLLLFFSCIFQFF